MAGGLRVVRSPDGGPNPLRAQVQPWAAAFFVAIALASPIAQERTRHGRLFPPADLGSLEGPDRDAWQQPGRIMDALGIADGSVVADIGAGGGWFTVRLARRVGPNGLVYAEDVQRQMIDAIARRVQRENLTNVRTVLGRDDDPGLPKAALDAVLIVDAYHEVQARISLLRNIGSSLKTSGRLGIVDFKSDGGGPGPPLEERIDPALVIRDAESAGLRLLAHETFLPYQYLLVFGKQPTSPATPAARLPDGAARSIVVGLDISDVMLEQARLHSRAFHNIRFVQGSAEDLPFQDRAFPHEYALAILATKPTRTSQR